MGKRRARRQFNADFKRRVVVESYAPGTSVSVVARRHDTIANLLFRWRDDPRNAFQEQCFLPVEMAQQLKLQGLPVTRLRYRNLGYGLRVMFALLLKAGSNRRPWAS